MVSNSVTEHGRREPGRPPRKRRRWTKIITVVVVLVGLLVAADFGLAAMAEHTVSQKAREQLDLRTDPNVTVHGFPFITQAVSGEYDHISVQAKGIEVNEVLRSIAIKADLRDVRAPLGDLLSGDVSNVTIGELDGQVKLKESVIANIPPLTKIKNLNIEPTTEEYVRKGEAAKMDPQEARERGAEENSGDEPDAGKGDLPGAGQAPKDGTGAGNGTGGQGGQDEATEPNGDGDPSTTGIRISGDVRIAGDKVEIFAFAIVKLDGSTISIQPQRLQFAHSHRTTVVPPKVQKTLLPNFRVDINAADLPFTVTPTDIQVTSGAVIIKGEAENVRFSEFSLGG